MWRHTRHTDVCVAASVMATKLLRHFIDEWTQKWCTFHVIKPVTFSNGNSQRQAPFSSLWSIFVIMSGFCLPCRPSLRPRLDSNHEAVKKYQQLQLFTRMTRMGQKLSVRLFNQSTSCPHAARFAIAETYIWTTKIGPPSLTWGAADFGYLLYLQACEGMALALSAVLHNVLKWNGCLLCTTTSYSLSPPCRYTGNGRDNVHRY
jgi:hypothetical protein